MIIKIRAEVLINQAGKKAWDDGEECSRRIAFLKEQK